MAHKASNSMSDALMLLGGGVIGAGIALLFAPYPGVKSRKKMVRFGKMVSNKSDKVMDNLNDFAETVSGRASKIARMWH